MWQYTVSPESDLGHIEDRDAERRKMAEREYVACTARIQNDTTNITLYRDRAQVLTSLKKYDLAAQDLSTVMKLDPEKKYFYLYLRHRQYLYLGDAEKALADISEAVRLAPGDYDYHRSLAYVQKLLGKIDLAIEALNQGIAKYPTSHSYLNRAAFYEGIGRLEDALKDIDEAVRISPANWSIYHDRVGILIKLGQFTSALADCNKCIEAQPTDWGHFRLRSEVHKAMGDSVAADHDYMTSMNLNPSINR